MNIAILGATGSIGTQTLDVVRSCLPDARVRVLTGHKNMQLLAKLVDEFRPELVWVPTESKAEQLMDILRAKGFEGYDYKIYIEKDGLITCAAYKNTDIVVNALVGKAGLAPTLAAIKAGKDVALANKESLVTAGGLIMGLARVHGVRIVPIDSEHSAIMQCLQGNTQPERLNNQLSGNAECIEKLILTASGGPFRTWPMERIKVATAADALRHPNWAMGAKITVDSATLMNKGLELIEAMWLFDQPMSNIDILVHPQSIIHSMVQFIDGSVIAQMGTPDMRMPILFALVGLVGHPVSCSPMQPGLAGHLVSCSPMQPGLVGHPYYSRVKTDFPRLDFLSVGGLTFEPPDVERFPCLALAKYAAEVGGTLPTVMNAINEWAVEKFLQDKMGFYGISTLIAEAFGSYNVKDVGCPGDIEEAEDWAFEFLKKQA